MVCGPRAASLILALGLLAGCSRTPEGRPRPAGEVNLAFAAAPGMRLTYQVRRTWRLTGEAARTAPEAERVRQSVGTKVMAVTAATGETFDVRLSEDDRTVPATLRFARNWVLQRVIPDDPGRLTEPQWTALTRLPELFQVQSRFYRRWRVGESIPWAVTVSGSGGRTEVLQGSLRLTRMVTLDGRPAAEFTAEARGRLGDQRVETSGESWVDVASGIVLRARARTTHLFTVGGLPGRMEIEQDELLDREQSSGPR